MKLLTVLCSMFALVWTASPQPSRSTKVRQSAKADNIVALITQLVNGGGLNEKGEFETSDHYKSKMDALRKANDKRFVFIKPSEDDEFIYDADRAVLHMNLQPGERIAGGDDLVPSFALSTTTISRRSYMGSNAFGVKKLITASVYNQYWIAAGKDSGYEFSEATSGQNTFDSLERDVPMDVSRAKLLKPYLRFAFYGRLADAHVFFDSRSTTATIESPYEHVTRYLTVLFTIDLIKVVDSRTGLPVSDCTNALNTIYK
jgi:hypothetical protein